MVTSGHPPVSGQSPAPWSSALDGVAGPVWLPRAGGPKSYGVRMSLARPRGPLPKRVYWTRRVLVLGLALGLVLGIGRLLGGDSDASGSPEPAAAVGSASATPSATSSVGAQPAGAPTDGPKRKKKDRRVRVPLATPTGPCQDSDVRVDPAMQGGARAGGDVRLTLELRTFESPACNWDVSADTLAVRLTSGSDRIWSSQECPSAVPDSSVVLRDRRPVLVEVTWSGRRSDASCSRNTLWAEPGWYHVTAAAMGSDPRSQQFELLSPAPVTITPTPTPKPEPSEDAKQEQGDSGQAADD